MEYGSHDELMKRQGVYYSLVVAQGTQPESNEEKNPKKFLRCKIIFFKNLPSLSHF
jgi:hypothetical protein